MNNSKTLDTGGVNRYGEGRQMMADILQADKRIKAVPGLVYETPLTYSPLFSEQTGADVWLKCEHLQQTGSFKLRGASNKILSLTEKEKKIGVITASSGNHGMGVALAARLNHVKASVYVPRQASRMKLDMIRHYGAEIITVNGGCLAAELEAGRRAEISGRPFISPYNDPEIIAGQGTVGLEILDRFPRGRTINAVFVSVGGGGLISGIGAAIRQKSPDTRIAACWPANSPAMYECLKAGKIIEVQESDTLSDGTAGGVEPDALTFPICREVIDEKILVSENDIREAMKEMAQKERMIIEGAAAVALAGFLQTAGLYRDKAVVIVLCGRNIQFDRYLQAVS